MSWVVGLLLISLTASAASSVVRKDPKHQPDTLNLLRKVTRDMEQTRKMSTSLYPVQLHVNGRLVRIQSDHNQILPIYKDNGSFYMAMRLTKGTNWLNGLPRGRYFINNRPVSIR